MKLSKMTRFLSIVILLGLAAACVPSRSATPPAALPTSGAPQEASATLKIAVLPIIDTLPMFVAQKEGLFEKHSLKVELIPVASAPERDQLLAAGQADGAINETLAVMLFNKDQVQMQAVRYALVPTATSPHFFILASGKSEIQKPPDLKGVPIGVSQGTVIEYVTERVLQAEGLASADIQTTAVPKIPDRMALLASGELKAGVLPDPLASLAVLQGARVVTDDSKYPQYGFSVISFRKAVIDSQPGAVRAFLAAIEEATDLLAKDSSKYTALLSERKLVPEPLIGKYQIPIFPKAGVPTEAEWADALSWAKQKGMVSNDVSYAESVNSSLLP
ncbi:MAG TPA: ABC transporter substrate-binding protein [Anaerolineales bacterium]